MKRVDAFSKLSFCIFAVLVIEFIYYGISTSFQGIFESDSVIFHIPIAEQLSKFTFMPANLTLGLGYLPATAGAILAAFILLHIPINLYNVFALILLFIFAKKVGESFGLSKHLSIVFAAALSTLNTVLRWPLTQIDDLWVGVFFLISLYLLKKPKKGVKYFLLLGVSIGMLIGMKFSGLVFASVILILFAKKAFTNINPAKILVFSLPVIILGFSWYIRNLILTGNPLYPVGFFFLKGDPTYDSVNSGNWSIFASILKNPSYIINMISALVSEFFIWIFSLVLPVYALIKNKSAELKKLSVAAIIFITVWIFLFPAESLVSNMRHVYPLIFITILEAFLIFKNREEWIGVLTIFGMMGALANLNYHPKLLILAIIPVFYLVFVNKKFFDKVERL